jgi:hypothetical protein
MDTALAALFMLEMLYDISHEELAPVEIAFFQGAIEKAARWPDKRMPIAIFLIAGLFAHQHDRRGRGALANNRLRRVNVQRAALAASSLGQFARVPLRTVLANSSPRI